MFTFYGSDMVWLGNQQKTKGWALVRRTLPKSIPDAEIAKITEYVFDATICRGGFGERERWFMREGVSLAIVVTSEEELPTVGARFGNISDSVFDRLVSHIKSKGWAILHD